MGRWTAKAAVGAFLAWRGDEQPAAIEILADDAGAPGAFSVGRLLPVSLSLSHSHDRALCAIGEADIELGCDLERIEPRTAGFIASYFTRAERDALATSDTAGRDLLSNLFWSAKESALKALRRGLRADTRSVEVAVTAPLGRAWGGLEVDCRGGTVLAGCWARFDDLVATIVCRPPLDRIIDLDCLTGSGDAAPVARPAPPPRAGGRDPAGVPVGAGAAARSPLRRGARKDRP